MRDILDCIDTELWHYPDAAIDRGQFNKDLGWLRAWDDCRVTLIGEVIRIMTLPAMMPEEIIKRIQVEEAEAITSLSIDELATRIELYQRASRELKVKEFVTRRKLHDKLSSMSDSEVAKHITKIPAAETETRVRKEKKEFDSMVNRESKVRKPKGRRSFDDKLAALALTNKDFADFLTSLSPAKKEE